ncbi:MAG: TonB C-terminal domain-containing protein [Arcobacter sp.]|nr:TonB C-terminal domain-containing protein [Bryobacteraceae bacterium]MDW8434559.1 TonB C-terminal domain-containing protein [Arcobacter sp.]
MRRRKGRGRAEALPAGAREVPLLASCEELQQRSAGLWWGSQAFSLLLHAVFAASIIQTGVIVLDYSMRFGAGSQFGRAILLVSPLFEIGGRDATGGRGRNIPLSALVPEQKLYEPDLRRLLAAAPLAEARPGDNNAAAAPQGLADTASVSSLIALPGGGGGALPAGALPENLGKGAATPFDLVPPSNTRERRPEKTPFTRLRVGDASAAGGGAGEGMRLPASPARVGISLECIVDARITSPMEDWLRRTVSRLRRASFELMPDRRDLGRPGTAVLAAEFDPVGRIVRLRLEASSGNPSVDRLALSLLESLPASHPLPEPLPGKTLPVTVRVRYFPAR